MQAGDIYANPLLFVPGVSGSNNLMPMYDRVYKEIRKIDNETSYFLFEGGNRYYIGNDYDNGLAGYGGSGLVLGVGKVRKSYDKTDVSGTYAWENQYQTDPSEIQEGKIFTIGGFLQGGMKYTIPATGTFYADLTAYYLLLANGSNSTASQTDFISPFFFNFTIGFKKDLY